MNPFFLIKKLIRFVAHRTTKRFNVLKIRSLSSDYWDKDEIMLHAIMQLVVDFVEIECAFMVMDQPYTFKERLYLKLPWFLRSDNLIRSRERGLQHLDELISVYEDRMKDASDAPRNIKEVYIWWKDIRPQRKQTMESLFINSDGKEIVDVKVLTKLVKQEMALEKKFEKEDEKMLKLIISARTFMWT